MNKKFRNIGQYLCLIILLFCSSYSYSQIYISLKNQRIYPSAKGFQIVSATSSSERLGSLFTVNGSRENVYLSGGAAKSIQNYLIRNLIQDSTGVKVIFKVKELSIKEKKINTERIEGELRLWVGFERISKNDTVEITSAEAGHTYTRTLGTAHVDNYEPLIRKSIISTIKYLNGWFGLNSLKDERLAKGVKIVFLPDTLQNDEDTIYHYTRKLTWDDFRGRRPAFSPPNYGAAVFANFAYTSKFTVKEGIIWAYIQVKPYMVRGMSWASTESKTESALAHEQIHFDIARVISERFKKRILELEAETIDDLNSLIQYEYIDFYREMNQMQKAYDAETNHSLNISRQAEWAEKISKQLQEFNL